MSNVIFHMSLTLAPTVTSRDPPLQRRVPAGEGKNMFEPKQSQLENKKSSEPKPSRLQS